MENLTNDTPPQKGFGPPSYGTFSTPLTCQCSVFPVQKSTTEQTRRSFGGVQKFSGERVLWYVFHPPNTFCTPPYHGPRDTGRLSLGHPAGQTGVYRPVSQGFRVVYCRETGNLPGQRPGVLGTSGRPGGFETFYVSLSYVWRPFMEAFFGHILLTV